MSIEATLTQSQQELLSIIRAQNAEHVSGTERKKAPFKTAVKDIFDVVGYTANTVSNVMAVASDKSFAMRQESRIDTMMALESKEEVEQVTYGMDIPKAYQSEPLKAMLAQKS